MAELAVLERTRRDNAFDRDLDAALGQLNAATARVVGLLRQALEDRTWEREGCRSPEHWVAVRCGVAPARAARLVRIAGAVSRFPAVTASATDGQVTEDHLDLIARHAHPVHDRALDGAGKLSTGQLRRVLAVLPSPDPVPDVPTDDPVERPSLAPAVETAAPVDVVAGGWCDDGRYRAHVDVGAELGTLFEQALTSARTALHRDRAGHDPDDLAALASITTCVAFERVLHAALDGLDPAIASGRRPTARHQVLLLVDAEHPERSRVDLGPVLSAAARRSLTCDADVRSVLREGARPIALGRRARVAPPVLAALVADRDGGCRIDGCGHTRWLHTHHLVHWEDGGPTDPTNLVALCPAHHRDVHAGRLRLSGDPTTPDGLVVLGRDGRPLPRPSPVPPGGPPPPSSPYHGPDRSERLSLRWF